MEYLSVWPFGFAVATIVALSLLQLIRNIFHVDHRSGLKKAPEASGGWPLLGHLPLLDVKVPPCRVLGDMADKYGPIFTIRLGRKPALIVSSWEMARECFGTHDKIFLNRPYSAAVNQAYDGAVFGFGPSGQYWRNMRRISMQEHLSNTRLEFHKKVRSSEVKACIKHLFLLCQGGSAKVDLSEWTSLTILNVMMQVIAGKRCSMDEEEVESRRFVKSTDDFTKLLGMFVVSDVIPLTQWMDLQGHFKAVRRTVKEFDSFISKLLEEHVHKRREGKVKEDESDFIDIMLSTLEEDPSLSCQHSMEVAIKSTILNLIIGATGPITSIVTWALSLLVNHCEVLEKVQNELETQVGKERWAEESDIRNLAYLSAVVKETLRLYVPLGVPRECMEDCNIADYHIPKGTILIVNINKLHRDPRVWSNPSEFYPERFFSNVHAHLDMKGKNFEFIPFSIGRRSCPGMTLGMQMVCLVVARVLQGFNLDTPDGQKVDLTEGLGLIHLRATPLELILTPRLQSELY